MKCSSCDEEMEVVVVMYTVSTRYYKLNEETGEYWAHETLDMDGDEEFWCERCGHELCGKEFDKWYGLVHEL